MENFYKDSLEKIKRFYTEKIDDSNINVKIFEILQSIIPFDSGCVYYLNADEASPVYSFNADSDEKFILEEKLFLNDTAFGIIKINRSYIFGKDENIVFKTCAQIIANLIKDTEMSSIIKMQLDMLQEGIQEKSREYKKILEEEKAKNKFIANVSHELRSPLNSIMGFTELLHSQFVGKLNEKQLEYIDDIKIASLHLLNMVNEILDMSKIESGSIKLNLSKFDLLMNIKEVLNILQPLYFKKKLDIICEVSENTEITADYQKLQQILLNLLTNAIKYTPENGTIEIIAKQTDKYLTLSIKDNGCGIDKKYHKKIFNKFEQITETANSTGLGLTITKELIKLHNGKITLKSELGVGSEFIVKFSRN